jgi:hypothetical protein
MFIWKACHNLLPTKTKLFHRGVCENQSCPICLREDETVEHCVWDCLTANDVWGASVIKLQKCQTGRGSFSHIFLEVIEKCKKDKVELFTVIARKIRL